MPSLSDRELEEIGDMLKEYADNYRTRGIFDQSEAASQYRDFGFGNTFNGLTIGEPQPFTSPERQEESAPPKEESEDGEETLIGV